VARYIQLYSKYIYKHRLMPRQFTLEAQIKPDLPLDPAQIAEAESIDKLRTQGMLYAEKHCRKLNMGAVDFSLNTEGPRNEISFWRIAIRRRRGIRVRSRLWKRRKVAARIKAPTKQMSLDDMYKELRACVKRYREAKKHCKDSRLAFIETFDPKQRKRILRGEEQRRLGKISKSLTGKLAAQGVTQIQPVDATGQILIGEDGSPITYTEQKDIETCLFPINEAKAQESTDTPPLQEPLLSELGYTADTDVASAILDGAYEPVDGIDHYARLVLDHIETPRPIIDSGECSRFISTEDHVAGWKKAKEQTSAGLSGLHFGMFKAQAAHPALAALDASMRNIAYVTGYTYERWKTGIDVQLLKRAQDHRAHKLRTILLLEADFNMNNKKLGRDVMAWAEAANALARDNYGGRKYLRAVEVSLNSTLTYNSLWAKRKAAVMMSNDAKGCFDRIAHAIAVLCLRRLGCPNAPIQSIITAIQEMKHHIRTAFGDSDKHYGGNGDTAHPPQGLLQGNGARSPNRMAGSQHCVDQLDAIQWIWIVNANSAHPTCH
jgi:hypothetical protein